MTAKAKKVKFRKNSHTFAERLSTFRNTVKYVREFETRPTLPLPGEITMVKLQLDAFKDVWGAETEAQRDRLWNAFRRWV